MPNYYTGSNRLYGKRKRSGSRSGGASTLSRKLFGRKMAYQPQLSAMVMDKAVARVLKRKQITAPEQKFFETALTGQALSVTSGVNLLSGITEGDAENQRTGLKVRVTKIEFSAIIVLNPTSVGGSDNGKVSLFIFKQANGLSPQFTCAPNQPQNAPYNSNGAASYPLLKNGMQEDQFYIIKDFDYSLDANAGAAAAWQSDCQCLRAEVSLDRVLEFNGGNGGNASDAVKNSIWIGYVGMQGAAAPTQGTLTMYARIWFTDA